MKRPSSFCTVLAGIIVCACPAVSLAAEDWGIKTREIMRLCRLPNYHQAIKVASEALAIAERDYGPTHLNTARSLNNLAYLHFTVGRLANAEPLYLRAIDILEALPQPNHHEHAIALDNLSRCSVGLRKFGRGEELARRTIQVRTKAWGSPYPDWNKIPEIGQSTVMLGEVEAMPFDRVLRAQIKSFGPETEGAANLIHNRGINLTRIPIPAYSELLYRRALEIRTKVHGPIHPLVADTTFRVAELHEKQGAFDNARRDYQKAIDILTQAKGANAPMLRVYRSALARVHGKQGNQQAANRETLRNMEQLDKQLGRPTPENRAEQLEQRRPPRPANAPDAELQNLLATAKMGMDRGNYAMAEGPLKNALARQEKLLGPKHRDLGATLEMLGVMSTGLARYAEAQSYLSRALAVHQASYGRQHPYSLATLILLAELYSVEGKTRELTETTQQLREANVIAPSFTARRARYRPGPVRAPASSWNAKTAANWYRNWGAYQQHFDRQEYDNALGTARLQTQIASNTCGLRHLNTALAKERLALCLQLTGAAVQAEPEFKQALQIRDQLLGTKHPISARTRIQLANLYLQEKKYAAAEPFLVNAISVLEKAGGQYREDLLRGYGGLEQVYRALNRPAEADRIMARMAELGAG